MCLKTLGRQKLTAEPLVHEPRAAEVELAIDKLKRHKSPGIDQITAKLIEAGLEQLSWRFINLFLLFGRSRKCLKCGSYRS